MDDHVVIIVLEYHVMADNTGDAIKRAIDNVQHEAQDLLPHDIMVTIARPR
jgi:hypothetical protein